MEVNKDEDEEFYERIEAPKFVDFTKPYRFRTDEFDRYWFCSRVGCDLKHEEEINPEEISKNFVFRVLEARSPNIKLRKALHKEPSSIKCPLSAPAKPSKPKIPRLPMVDSLISHKNGDPQSKNGPCPKVGSAPVAKTRQVASKYMTTPRNKLLQPNHNSSPSVENLKTTTVDEPESRTVAKGLVFHSPKNGDPLNKTSKVGSTLFARSRQVASKYMTTPRKRVSQPDDNSFLSVQNSKANTVDVPKIRTVSKGLVFRSPKKSIISKTSGDLHTPITKICEGMKRLQIASQKKTLKGSRSKPGKSELEDSSRKLKICKNEKKDSAPSKTYKKTLTLHEQVVNVKPSDDSPSEISKKEEDLQPQDTSDTSDSHALRAEMNKLSDTEDKENILISEDHLKVNGKENALNARDNNRSNNQLFGDNILSKEIQKKNKIVQSTAGPAVIKCSKPKPTSVKPFRLRTDERGILKEGFLERKFHLSADKKEVAKDARVIKQTDKVPRNEKLSTSFRTRSQSVQMPGQQLSVIEENPSKLTSDVNRVGNKIEAVSTTGSTSRRKWRVTVAKEPNFHTSPLPRTCWKKIA